MILINLVLLLFWLFTEWIGFASRSDITQVVWMLGAFLLRTFWFIGFELGSRAATPGKRLMGIRVVARDGGRLTADAVEIGRAHVCTPVTNAHLLCRLLLEKKTFPNTSQHTN